jgi:hypothetical protein
MMLLKETKEDLTLRVCLIRLCYDHDECSLSHPTE